jgi:hypothetical protein
MDTSPQANLDKKSSLRGIFAGKCMGESYSRSERKKSSISHSESTKKIPPSCFEKEMMGGNVYL